MVKPPHAPRLGLRLHFRGTAGLQAKAATLARSRAFSPEIHLSSSLFCSEGEGGGERGRAGAARLGVKVGAAHPSLRLAARSLGTVAPSKGHFNVTAQQPGSRSEQALPNSPAPKPRRRAARRARSPRGPPRPAAPGCISKMENTSPVPCRHIAGGMESPLEMPSGPHTHTAVSRSHFTPSMWPQPPEPSTLARQDAGPHRPPALPCLVPAA